MDGVLDGRWYLMVLDGDRDGEDEWCKGVSRVYQECIKSVSRDGDKTGTSTHTTSPTSWRGSRSGEVVLGSTRWK